MPSPFIEDVARRLGTSPEAAREALRAFSGDLRHEAERDGAARVPALGTFRADEHGLAFEPSEALAQAVNHRFASLAPLPGAPAPQTETPAEASPAEASPAEASPAEAPLPEAAGVYETNGSESGAARAPDHTEAAGEPDATTAPPPAEQEPPPAEDRPAESSAALLPAPWTPYAVRLAEPFRNGGLVESDFVGARLLPPGASEAPTPPPAPDADTAPLPDRRAQTPSRPQKHSRPAAARERRPIWPWAAAVLAVVLAALFWFIPTAPNEAPADTAPEDAVVAGATPPPAEAPASEDDVADAALPPPGADEPASAQETPPAEATPLAPLGIERTAGAWVIVVSSKTASEETQPVLRDYRQRLSDLPYALDVVASATDAGTRYRVAVGPLPSLDAAQAALQEHAAVLPEGAWLLELEGE